jgi:hypothetical protein
LEKLEEIGKYVKRSPNGLQQVTAGFAILGQKQYSSALVRYLASVRAEVFQCSFLFLSSSSVFQLGSGSGQKIFKSPNIAKPYRYAPF